MNKWCNVRRGCVTGILSVALLCTVGCRRDEDPVEETGEALKAAGNATMDAVDGAGDQIQNAADEVGDQF